VAISLPSTEIASADFVSLATTEGGVIASIGKVRGNLHPHPHPSRERDFKRLLNSIVCPERHAKIIDNFLKILVL